MLQYAHNAGACGFSEFGCTWVLKKNKNKPVRNNIKYRNPQLSFYIIDGGAAMLQPHSETGEPPFTRAAKVYGSGGYGRDQYQEAGGSPRYTVGMRRGSVGIKDQLTRCPTVSTIATRPDMNQECLLFSCISPRILFIRPSANEIR